MMDNVSQQQNTSSQVGASSRMQLESILQGDLLGVKKVSPVIVQGNRISNAFLKKLINSFRKKGLTAEEIITKVVEYDGYVESGKITQETITKAFQAIKNKQ